MTKSIRKATVVVLAAAMIITAVLPFVTVYSNAATKKPAKPKIADMRANREHLGTGYMCVSWNTAKNAKQYEVWRKEASGSWKKLETTKKTYCAPPIKYGVKYQYKVRGLNGSTKGKYSAVKTITVPQPEHLVGKWIKFKEGSFEEEIFIKATTNQKKRKYKGKSIPLNGNYKDDGVNKEIDAVTRDGLNFRYRKNRIRNEVTIDIGERYKGASYKNTADTYNIHVSNGYVKYIRSEDLNTTSFSWTRDGSEPALGIGNHEGTVYLNGKEEKIKLNIGKMAKYGDQEVITGGSTDLDYFDLQTNMEFNNKCTTLAHGGYGAELILDDGRTADGTSCSGVGTKTPVELRARSYRGTERANEIYRILPY